MTTRRLLIVLAVASPCLAEENLRRVATWNMKWLGGSTGALDDTNNLGRYVGHIRASGARLVAVQEITPSHSEDGAVRCHYLDLIVGRLNEGGECWTYRIDGRNGSQRLGFLFDRQRWRLRRAETVNPGSAFRGRLRKPLVGLFKAVGPNAELELHIVNIHMKAFPDDDSRGKRKDQFVQLASWLAENDLDEDVLVCGDTNIYLDEPHTDKGLLDSGYASPEDGEATAIHEGSSKQRFDRFYISPGLLAEVESAKGVVGMDSLVDSMREAANGDFGDFARDVSDHFAVILVLDVSRERP